MSDDERSEDATPLALVSGKRLFTIGVGVLVLGLMMQLLLSQVSLVGPMMVLGAGIVIPLVAAIWAGKRRASAVLTPVLYGMGAGAVQVLIILIPLVITRVLYDTRVGLSLLDIVKFGMVVTCLSAALGALVGGVVCVLLLLIQPRTADSDLSNE